jgi:Fuc2NAc and GlcNAc transferase
MPQLPAVEYDKSDYRRAGRMMETAQGWLSLPLALALAATLTPLLRSWLLRCNLVDLPGERRSHDVPTPRGGGLAIAVAILLALLLAPVGAWWPGVSVLGVLALLGWLDDRVELPPSLRLAVQAATAVLGLSWLGPVVSVPLFGHLVDLPWLWTPLAGIAVVWLINLHNFMDGSDGLAAMQGVWSGLAFAVIMWMNGLVGPASFGFAMAGGFAGFLLWNRPPARIFMGDVGSMVLGGGVAMLALVGAVSGVVSVWLSLIVTSVFVVDATATLARRVMRGERWYTAHRQHAYQRLIVAGWSHGQVLALYAATNLLLVMPAAWTVIANPDLGAVIAIGLIVLLAGGWWMIQSATTTENQWHE